ncbi:MAG TPA: hypothetical protein PLN53_10225 [Terricaulis sp.]|nr:hypothetical protein [Terricaulis sp.]
MMKPTSFLLASAALCSIGACASTEDVRALRRPPLPPTYVALADHNTPLRDNIAVYEVLNVPEFRWFDGDAVFTTRPTRRDVNLLMNSWLRDANMLAPSIGEADYLLTLSFEELSGPDVVWFTDKNARAVVHYTLTCQRAHSFRARMDYGHSRSHCAAPGQVVFEGRFEASLQARMPGVTPEMFRSAVAGGVFGAMIGPEIAAASNVFATAMGAGAVMGDASARGVGTNAFQFELNEVLDALLLSWSPLDDLSHYDLVESLGLFSSGLVVAADNPRAALSYESSRRHAIVGGGIIGGLAAGNESASIGDPAARWLGGASGALIGMYGAAPAGRPVEDWDSAEQIGAFDGTMRRHQAVGGMLRQNFNRFLFSLRDAELLRIRLAVPCADLNPGGYGTAVFASTSEVVGYDCPVGRSRVVNQQRPWF